MSQRQPSTPTFRERLERSERALIGTIESLIQSSDPGEGADVEVLARALYGLLWQAGRLVVAGPAKFPAERLTKFTDQFLKTHFAE